MRKIFIVGASSGIGLALANRLTEQGIEVFGTFHQSRPDSTSWAIHPLNVLDEPLDLSFLPEAIDGLVYCPGAISLKPIQRISSEEMVNDYLLQTVGAVKVIQNVLPKLRKGTAPSIVLFSTVAVQTGFPFHSIVSASKGAIEGLTRALAAELAPTVRVNAIAPSITDTRLASTLLGTDEKRIASSQRHPLKRIGKPEDIAAAAAFLLEESSAWITGQVLPVDGGISSIKL